MDCCWAISVATVIGYLYHTETLNPNFELSSQDILDRVWLYYNENVRDKQRDKAGCYCCNVDIGFKYVQEHGVGYSKDYPFDAALNEKKDYVDPKTEYPRVYTGEPEKFTKIEDVIMSLKEKKRALIGVVRVTPELCHYKKEDGIYRHPTAGSPNKVGLGKHAVVIVGVNEEEGYLIIRNSWGPGWGDGGYGRVAYGAFAGSFTAPTSAFELQYPLNLDNV
ncbi:hypothetical protein OROMI_011676 [Orobanche minor]